ncbi:MAG: tetratricopeptide repeat protein [Betaproteobacteria bacterium]|nr:tetratricopeptide repeat protein [Betaproteobacteria bacterium]
MPGASWPSATTRRACCEATPSPISIPSWPNWRWHSISRPETVAQGRLSAAETYFNAALAIRRQVFGDGASTLPVLTALGRAYQSEGMNTSAIITFRSAFKIARTLPQSAEVISNEQLLPFVTAITEHAETLSDNNARQGLFAEAFEAFQLARSSLIDKTIAKAQARLAIDDPAIATLVEQLQATQRELEVARTETAAYQRAQAAAGHRLSSL